MRVGQEAQVEDQVGGPRNAAGESEGGDGQDRLIDIAAEAPAQLVAQLGRAKIGRVEHAVGSRPQRQRELPLAGDPVLGRTVGRERVDAGASRRSGGSAPAAGAVEIEHFAASTPSIEWISSSKRLGIEPAASDIHADRGIGACGIAAAVDEVLRAGRPGRLSTTSQPMSSSASRTVDLPAPDMPVTSSRRGSRRRLRSLRSLQAHAIERKRDLGRRRSRSWRRC